MGGHGPPGVEDFHPPAPPGQSRTFRAEDGRTHFNLLGWNGQGAAPHLFPDGGHS